MPILKAIRLKALHQDREDESVGIARRAGVSSGPVWLITFVDLISLLLAFFVLMFSMNSPKSPEWNSLAQSLHEAFSGPPRQTEIQKQEDKTIESEKRGLGLNIGYLHRLLDEALARDPALAGSVVRSEGDRVIVSVPSDLLFATGSDGLTERARRALYPLSQALANLENRVDVLGHTDPRPVLGTGRFGSNWELSLARAASVAQVLGAAGYDRVPTVRGLADTRFGAVAPALPVAERYQLARRVDIEVFAERGRRR